MKIALKIKESFDPFPQQLIQTVIKSREKSLNFKDLFLNFELLIEMNASRKWTLSELEVYSILLLRSLAFALRRTPRMIYHTLDYYRTGPPRPSWPLSMYLLMKTVLFFIKKI